MLEQPGDGLRPFVLGGMHRCFVEDVPRDVACRQTVQPSDVGGVGSVQVRLGDQPTVPIEEPLEPHIDAMLRVSAAKPLDGCKLETEFNDAVVRVVDCSFLLLGTLGEPLKDLDYFRQVRVDDDARTLVWPKGLDPVPELLHGGQESSCEWCCAGAGLSVGPRVVRGHESAWPGSTQRWEPGG